MKLIDTHCHLVSEKLRDTAAELVAAARREGVEKIINIAYDPETVGIACAQADAFANVYAAVGIQPHDAHSFTPAAAEAIRAVARSHPKIVAIGEIGLDDYHTLSPMPQQIECFEYFLEMALAEALPIIVHVRETHAAVAQRVKAFCARGGTGVIHCFTGSLPEAREFLEAGMHVSMSGIVTFKSAADLQEVAKFIPEDRLLIETDSPYLAPVPMRGKTNEPAFVRHVCDHVARLRGVTSEALAETTTRNAERLFPRLRDRA